MARRSTIPCIGLVLAGGGARGAYQIGALKAIAELVPDHRNPFPILSGLSVGAINAGALASRAQNFQEAVGWLEFLWGNLRADQVYRTDYRTIAKSGLHWMVTVFFGGLGFPNPHCLLDTRPLADLLEREIDFSGVEKAIATGDLEALAVTASSYKTAQSVTFFQSDSERHEWHRARRVGVQTKIDARHLLASSALPVVFDTVEIDGEHFGDGALRLSAPLSPPIHLGAEKILVVGVRDEKTTIPAENPQGRPSLGDIGGTLLDVLFNENLKADVERLERINSTLSILDASQRQQINLKPIETLVLRPSMDVRSLAREHARELPRSIRTLLKGIGALGPNWQTTSYLLFEQSFCRALIELGYRDTLKQSDKLLRFLEIE